MGVVLATRPNSTRGNASGRRSCFRIFRGYASRPWRMCRRNRCRKEKTKRANQDQHLHVQSPLRLLTEKRVKAWCCSARDGKCTKTGPQAGLLASHWLLKVVGYASSGSLRAGIRRRRRMYRACVRRRG